MRRDAKLKSGSLSSKEDDASSRPAYYGLSHQRDLQITATSQQVLYLQALFVTCELNYRIVIASPTPRPTLFNLFEGLKHDHTSF
jgi:hypothetical protein